MPLIRKQLKPSDVYPENMRYNETTDTIETNVNGEWVENPDADPRRQTTYPPRVTSDTRCDAAESVKTAFKNQIDSILLAIDNGGTAFTIAGFILGMLAFGPFGVFIGLALFVADQMLSAGTTALAAAFTEPVWEEFMCILFCNMDTNGRLNETTFGTVQTEVTGKIGGLAGTLLNGMLHLAGEGGVNNLASLGQQEGNCTDCDCGEDCPAKYEIWTATIGSYPYGNIIGTGDDYIDVENGPNGYMILKAININDCCFVNEIITLTGTLASAAWLPCGEDFTSYFNASTPVGQCCSYIQCQGYGTARVYLGTCP